MYSGHMSIEISASEFKAKCLALLDRVAATGETLVVTKRGKPVADIGACPGAGDERWNAEIE